MKIRDQVGLFQEIRSGIAKITIEGTERTPEEMDTAIRQLVARAGIRKDVKRLLRKYGYPPDKQEKATDTVLEQAETLCKDWTGAENE